MNKEWNSGNPLKLMALAVFLLFVAGFWIFTPISEKISLPSILQTIRNVPGDARSFFVFLMIFALGTCFFVPVALIALACSLVFSFWPGLLCSMLGGLLAAMTGYSLGRFFGIHNLPGSLRNRLENAAKRIGKGGALTIGALRLAPTPPFTITSLLAGSLHFPVGPYLVGSACGIAPLLILTQIFGVQTIQLLHEPSVSAVLGMIAVTIFLIVYFRFTKAKNSPAN